MLLADAPRYVKKKQTALPGEEIVDFFQSQL